MKQYFVILLVECHNLTADTRLYSEEFNILSADSLEEARLKAQARADEQATAYKNAEGEDIHWQTLEVVDVAEFTFEPDKDAVYTRMFRNKAAYDAYQHALYDEMWEEWQEES